MRRQGQLPQRRHEMALTVEEEAGDGCSWRRRQGTATHGGESRGRAPASSGGSGRRDRCEEEEDRIDSQNRVGRIGWALLGLFV
jgi:hypothetical protein